MLKIVVFAFLALLVVSVRSTPIHQNEDVEVIHLEEPCVRQGGLCVREDDCEESSKVLWNVDLCPIQRPKGVICCYM